MRRREFIGVIGGAAATWPLAARAQRPAMPLVGYLSANTSGGDARPILDFIKGLSEAGYDDGKTVKIVYRWADGQYDRLPSMAADLVRDQVAVIAAIGHASSPSGKRCDGDNPDCFYHDRRSRADRVRRQPEPPRSQCDRRDLAGGGNRTEAAGNVAGGRAIGHHHRAASESDQPQFRDAIEEYGGCGPKARIRTTRSERQRAKRFRCRICKAAPKQGERIDYCPGCVLQCRKCTARRIDC